ncbi:transposase [Streptomyces sp. NPDC004682]
MRITSFATNTPDRPTAELELRHRLRARAEDRICAARSTGLRNLLCTTPRRTRSGWRLSRSRLTCWPGCPCSPLTDQARLWEPRRLRFRLFSAAAQLVTTGRRRILRLARHWPWTGEISAALERLALLPNPGCDQRIPLSLQEEEPARSSGTRRPPEATLGPSECPPSVTESETVHRLRQRTVMQDRG